MRKATRSDKWLCLQTFPTWANTMSLHEFFFGFTANTRAKFPWIFETGEIDRHQCHRVVPMEVLSLGMGRTGTASMQKALTSLGYPTSHGFDMYRNKPDCDMWIEAINVKFHGDTSVKLDRNFWDKLLGHVSAVTDTPANMFAEELIESYPEAKVILTERDVDKWYPSFERALIKGLEMPFLNLFLKVDKDAARMVPVATEGIMKGQFGANNTKEYRKNAKEVYKRHYKEIRILLKAQPERLLEYKLGSGWKPLCDFLDKPAPQGKEFPWVNESSMHDEMATVVFTMLARRTVGRILKLAMPVCIAYTFLRFYYTQ